MLIGYYFCDAKTERNAQYKIHVLVNYDCDWPESVLRQRCLLGNRFFHRTATLEEMEINESHKRAQSYKYLSFDLLWEDEQRCYPDPAFLHGLDQAWRTLKR